MPQHPSKHRKKTIDTQELLGRVLAFSQYLRLSLILLTLGLLSGIIYYVYSDALYSSRGLINVRVFSYAVDSQSGEQGRQPIAKAKRSLATQLRSNHLLKQVAINMGLATESTSSGTVREKILPKVQVRFEDNDHLQLEVYSTSPHVVREFPAALIATYQQSQAQMRRDYREQAVAKYISELEGIKEKLANRMEAKSKFEEENALVDVFVAQKQLSQIPVETVWVRHRLTQMDELRSSLASKSTDRLSQLTLLSTFAQELPDTVGRVVRPEKEGASPIAVRENAENILKPSNITIRNDWEQLDRDRRIAEGKLAELKQTYGPAHDQVRKVEAQIANLNTTIDLELEAALQQFDREYEALRSREQALQKQLPNYHEITKKYEQFRLDFELLTKGELAWSKAHEEISKRIAALEFGADKDRVELQLLTPSNLRDKIPVTPNKMKLILISLIVGIGLAVGVPMLLEMFNTTASRIQQIENATGLTGIGIVPLCRRENLENVVRSPSLGATVPNQLLENFRIIRSNICLNPGKSGQSQVVMITSARPSEGKTTQAANIAWAFNSIGERTLLVDADLRRGRVHDVLQLDNELGMTNFLIGQATEEEVIQPSGLNNLDIITRGPIVAGSTEVFAQKKFEDIVSEWRQRYDRIIIDTPPVLGLSETGTIQRVADGVTLVIRAESTPAKDILDAVDLLGKTGAHLFGFVLNRIDLNKIANYYQYQYYSADYYAEFEEPAELALATK